MSSTVPQLNNNEEMASNISSLNNMTNLARNVENGIEHMAHLNQNNMMPQNKDIPLPQPPNVNAYNPAIQHYTQIPNIQNSIPQNTMIDNVEIESTKKSSLDNITSNLKEPILIAVVFVVLNHPYLLKALGKYIPQLNVGEDGPSVFNLVIRGLFLGSVVVILNKTVFK